MDIVDQLLDYRRNSDKKLLITSDINIVQESLNVIVIEILAWLRLEYKRYLWIKEGKKTSLKPLKLKMQYLWCGDLCRLIEKERIFQKYFKIENGNLYFSDAITEQQKNQTFF